jgi:hypothetical protein
MRRLAATCSDCPQGITAICCWLLADARAPPCSSPHNVASEVCLIHHHSPPRAANPLALRGHLTPYRPQHHALYILRAEALRTCRAAQSLCASLSPTDVALRLRCFCLLSFCSGHSCPPSGDRLEGLPLRNGFYSRLPATPVAQSPTRSALRLGYRGPTPQAHMPALISC